MKYLIAFICIFLIAPAATSFAGQAVPEPFKSYVSYQLGDNLLYLDPELARGAKMVGKSSEDDRGPTLMFPFAGATLSISYDPGMSDDPTFVVEYKEMVEYLGGEKLYVSADGSFYLAARSNQSFEKKLEFRMADGVLREIAQPFYLVDQQCRTTAQLLMYEDKCNQGAVVASLPNGATVRILLSENGLGGCPDGLDADDRPHEPVRNYLVATPFGLVGWVSTVEGDLNRPGVPLGCIRVQGD